MNTSFRRACTQRAAALALAALAALAGCGAALAQGVLAARVNGTPIPMERVDRRFEELLRERRLHVARLQDPAKAKAIKREALDGLIRIELLWQEAQSAGLAAADADVQRAVAEVKARFRSSEQFERSIERSGYTEAQFREHTRKLLSGERYAQRVVEREVQVTEQDIEDFYALNSRLFKRPEKVKVRQILIAAPSASGAEGRAQARGRIDALLQRARGGESFETLARQHSDDATRQWGGELDPFGRGEKAKPFEDAAFALAPGELSDVVETAAGLHLIRLEEKLPAVVVPLQAARERIREHLAGMRGKEAVDKEVEQLRSLGKVEVLTPL